MLSEKDLHPYQRRAVDFILEKPFCALWVDMGLGKTVSTLTAIKQLLREGAAQRVLVVAPLRVAQHTWPTEVSSWSHLSGLDICVAAGLPAKAREVAVKSGAPVTVINRENVPWLVDLFGQSWPFDVVVIDESSSFKSHASKRWKALRKVLGKIKRMIQLTGTPAPNSLIDLWPQVYLLDAGKRLGRTRGAFLQGFCEQVGNPNWNQWRLKESRKAVLHKRVSDLALRLSAEEFLELPPRVDVFETVKLPPKAMALYREMEKEFVVKVESGEITAANAAVQVGKLLQICNGTIYDENGDWHLVHTAKLNRLREIVEDAQEPILVAYSYRSEMQLLVEELGAKILDKNTGTIDKWNRGEIEVLLAHPASAGHGLNLQRGGALAVWFGPTFSLELYQQFNARLHRQGQTKPVRVLHLLSETPAEASVMEAIKNKKQGQEALLQFMQNARERAVPQ